MSIIGLTGDVGAGKSTLCKEWAAMGACIIDADTVARSLWDDPEIQRKAEERWGAGFFNAPHKELWAKIAAKIFTDEEEYAFSSKLLHAKTIEKIKEIAEKAGGWVVAEIPLLYEGGYDSWLKHIVYATAPFAKRVERNATRNWNANEVSRRECRLLPSEQKIAKAEFVLVNDGTLDEWRAKARELGEKLRTL